MGRTIFEHMYSHNGREISRAGLGLVDARKFQSLQTRGMSPPRQEFKLDGHTLTVPRMLV